MSYAYIGAMQGNLALLAACTPCKVVRYQPPDLLASWGACTFKGHYCNRYKLGKVLGAGSFGIVREATERKTGRRYACKTIPKVPQCPSAPACQQYVMVGIQLLGFCLLPSCGKRGACL